MHEIRVILVVALAYVIGSFPTAYLVGRLNGINIFEIGSGNMGTTNTLRSLGVKWAILVAVTDLSKGILAVLVGLAVAKTGELSGASASVIAAVAVVVGHNWSLFASLLTGTLRGGKGAATAMGTWLLLVPLHIVFIPVVILIIAVARTRLMSLGVLLSLAGAAISIGVMIALHQLDSIYLLYYLVGAVMLYRFRDNIKRLIDGNERRIGETV